VAVSLFLRRVSVLKGAEAVYIGFVSPKRYS
jgi:hypothetical protein